MKKETETKPVKCTHENVYVAVRHTSGLRLLKCKDCNAYVN